jgi:hypothetical protein
VTALLAEQKTAELGDELLRFVLYEGAALVKVLCQYSDTSLLDCRVSAVVSSA